MIQRLHTLVISLEINEQHVHCAMLVIKLADFCEIGKNSSDTMLPYHNHK